MNAGKIPSFLLPGWMVVVLLILSGCGYHTAGHAVRLPSNLHTLYVPTLSNATSTYRVEQALTAAMIRELRNRTNYRIITKDPNGEADATLSGVVTGTSAYPLTTGTQSENGISVTGVTSSLVTVSVQISLKDRTGRILWNNPNYVFHDQYQVALDVESFFEESGPALQRIATDFSRTLVSDMLEAY